MIWVTRTATRNRMFLYRLKTNPWLRSRTNGPSVPFSVYKSTRCRLVDLDFAQQTEVTEHLAGSQHHAGQGIIGDRNRQTGFFADTLVKILDQRTAPGEYDATVTDIGAEFRRGTLQGHADGIENGRNTFRKCFTDLAVINGDGLGHAFDQVASFDLHGQRLVQRIGRPNVDLDLLCGALTDEQVVLTLEVIHDRFVHLVAGHADGTGIDDAGERDDGDIRGAAADIHHHVAAGFSNRQACADGSDHGLFDQEHLACLGAISGVFHRPLLHLRDLRRHPNHDPRVHQHLAVVRLLDEVVQHLFGDFEVGNDAVFHRLDGDDIPRSAAEHLLGFFANRLHFAGILVNSDDGGLIDDDALTARIHQGVRGS